MFDNKDDYYKNFAPTYLDLLQLVNETREELKKLSDQLADLNAYKSRFKNWFGSEIDDVQFEDIK